MAGSINDYFGRKEKTYKLRYILNLFPDFIIPSEFNPQVIIEAKITEDDGTARDKVTRIQHLGELSLVGQPKDKPKYEVIACIGGRGFGVRREDMKKMILATKGKVFTAKTLNQMIDYTRLKEFRTNKHRGRVFILDKRNGMGDVLRL